MHITFGLDLDACQGPSPEDNLARPVVGRLGMLSLLETWLGLAAPEVGHARRVAVYLGALRQADGPQRFYHRSLAADDVGTAAHLLDWRDTWALAGWAGHAGEDAPQRLRGLAGRLRAAGRLEGLALDLVRATAAPPRASPGWPTESSRRSKMAESDAPADGSGPRAVEAAMKGVRSRGCRARRGLDITFPDFCTC